MRGNMLLEKMTLIDPAYVEAADAILKKNKSTRIKWAAAAACLALAAFAGSIIGQTPPSSRISIGGIIRKYKNVSVTENLLAIEWPWEYKTISEQYTTLILDGKEFLSGRSVDASRIADNLGRYDVTGFDTYTGQEHRMTAEVYRIAGISQDRLVAVKLDGEFYVFSRNEYVPPKNLGEMLDDYSLEQNLSLERFSECDGYKETGFYRLNDDAYIWQVLNTCRSAEFTGDDILGEDGRNLSFTATSDALGIYKRVFCVTEDGYIKTNLFDYAYIFHIGSTAAEQILSYAAENRIEAAPEPYMSSLAGILTEITDEYILVDDTVLCADEKDGMRFKIYLDDLRISRHIDFEGITVGDVVVVSFTGSIDVEAGNAVEGVYSLSRGFLSEDGISVPE